MLTKQIATSFSEKLLAEIGEENLEEVKELNSTRRYSDHCASHDYCDANILMLAAWQEKTGREFDFDSETDVALWCAAWDIAKNSNFNF